MSEHKTQYGNTSETQWNNPEIPQIIQKEIEPCGQKFVFKGAN